MQAISIDTAQAEFNAALQCFQTAQTAYIQTQETIQHLQSCKADLQAKVQQYEAAAEAGEQEFKALFAAHGFLSTPDVKSAMHKKMANKDMAAETAVALAECHSAIEDFPFKDDVVRHITAYASARETVRKKYAALMLARALSEVPESLIKAIALHQHLARLDDADYKGAVSLSSDLKDIMAAASRPIFEAMQDMAQDVDVGGAFEAAGITDSATAALPAIPRKSSVQLSLYRQKKLTQLHSQR